MTPHEIGTAIRAFRTPNCPACDAVKVSTEDPFCADCMALLPEDLHDDIVLKENFINKFRPAMEILKRGNGPGSDPTNPPPVPE